MFRFYNVEIHFYHQNKSSILKLIRETLGWDDRIIGIGQNNGTLHSVLEKRESLGDIENAIYYV